MGAATCQRCSSSCIDVDCVYCRNDADIHHLLALLSKFHLLCTMASIPVRILSLYHSEGLQDSIERLTFCVEYRTDMLYSSCATHSSPLFIAVVDDESDKRIHVNIVGIADLLMIDDKLDRMIYFFVVLSLHCVCASFLLSVSTKSKCGIMVDLKDLYLQWQLISTISICTYTETCIINAVALLFACITLYSLVSLALKVIM